MDCKDCGSEFVSVTSSREMEITQIHCTDCGDLKQYKVPEDEAVKSYKIAAKSKT